jgi:hypothetical protein
MVYRVLSTVTCLCVEYNHEAVMKYYALLTFELNSVESGLLHGACHFTGPKGIHGLFAIFDRT